MIQAATIEAIERAARMFGTPQQEQKTDGLFDVAAYLTHYGIGFKVKGNGSKTIYALDHCVFDSGHVNNDAAVFQFADGKLGYKCFHDSCSGKGWKEAREKISGSDSLGRFMPGGKQAKKEEPEEDLEISTIGEIYQDPEEFQDPLIENLLENGDNLLVSGKGGLGKSLVMDAVSLSLATGKKLFDLFEINGKHRVLLIQSENSRKATKLRRIAQMEQYKKRVDFEDYLKGLDWIFTLTRKRDPRVSGDIMNESFSKLLVEALEKTKAEVLILDPLISYHRKPENDNVAMREALDFLRDLVGSGISIILTHHHGKGEHTGADQARGATAIQDWARGILTLNAQKHEQKNLVKVCHTKSGNFKKAKDFLLEIDGPCVMPVEPDVLCPPSRVVQILKDIGGTAHSKNELITAICEACEVARKTAQDAIDQTCDMGFIRSWKDGQAYQYGII